MSAKHKTHDAQRIAVVQRVPAPAVRMETEREQVPEPGLALGRIVNKAPAALRPADILALQRTAGNRVVQRLLSNRPRSVSSVSPTSGHTIQRQAEEEEETLQGKFETPGVIQRFPVTEEARGAAHTRRGGTSMTAKVGGQSEWVYGSGTPGGVPNLLTKVGAYMQGTQRYIAGHLLNDNMGGQGVNNNLTVLSADGNKKHRGVEGKVENLAQKADLINKGNNVLGDPAYDHGARYTVTVLAPNPGAPPFSQQERQVGAGLQINIDPIRVHKISGVESVWPEEAGGANDLTNHIVQNVPPYPLVPKKKKLTPIQRNIVTAIVALSEPSGSSLDSIWRYFEANVPGPSRQKVTLALKRGVSAKFFFKRGGAFKVIAKNIA